jgi:hypothetical protein
MASSCPFLLLDRAWLITGTEVLVDDGSVAMLRDKIFCIVSSNVCQSVWRCQ